MNHRQRKPPLPITSHPAYHRAIRQLNEAIVRAEEGPRLLSDEEKRRRMREIFGLQPK